MKNLTRREMLVGAAFLSAGTMAASSLGMPLANGAQMQEEYPWPYRKIDPGKAAEIAYDNYYRNGCSYGTASGILVPLRETAGFPYTVLPLEAFGFGRGGIMDWGTTCGTLVGAGFVLSLAAGKNGEEILNEMMNWYSETALPLFVPEHPRAEIRTVNKSASPLCHVSLGKWMAREGVSLSDPRRKERCARLSADVAMKTALMLNAWADRRLEIRYGSQSRKYGIATQNNCSECHGKKVPAPPRKS